MSSKKKKNPRAELPANSDSAAAGSVVERAELRRDGVWRVLSFFRETLCMLPARADRREQVSAPLPVCAQCSERTALVSTPPSLPPSGGPVGAQVEGESVGLESWTQGQREMKERRGGRVEARRRPFTVKGRGRKAA